MHQQAFTTLEFQQLRELVMRGAQTKAGRARIARIEPLENLPALQRELASLSECVGLRNRGVIWSFTDLMDPDESIGLLRVEGSALGPNAILELARLCEQAL